MRIRLTKPVRQSDLLDAITKTITAESCAEEAPVAAAPSDPAPVTKGLGRILLVEDHPINREVAVSVLALLGEECDIACNGLEALDRFDSGDFGLVLMDCQMPEMDGYETTRQIRKREARERSGAHVPIVALTANALKEDRSVCLKAGMDDYLAKPFTKDQIEVILKKWLWQPEMAKNRAGGAEPLAETEENIEEMQINVLDPETIDILRGMDIDGQFLRRLISVFLEKTPGDVQQIRDAVNNNDPDAVRRTAHAFKSSSRNMGAVSLAYLCESLEVAGRTCDLSRAEVMFKSLNEEVGRVSEALAEIQDEIERSSCQCA